MSNDFDKDIITIIIPAYNREDYIKQCLDSIIKQTYSKLDIIIVNDGSTDSTPQICHEFEKLDGRIRVYDIKNSGVSNARNIGIQKAIGKYIAFIDSDDYVAHEYIEKLYAALIKNECGIAMCDFYEFNNLGEKKLRRQYYRDFNSSTTILYDVLYNRINGMSCWGKLFDSEMIDHLFEPYKYCEDVLFFFDNVANREYKVINVAEPLYYYRVHEKSVINIKAARDLYDSLSVATEMVNKSNHISKNLEKASISLAVNYSFFALLNIKGIDTNETDMVKQKCKDIIYKYRSAALGDAKSKFTTKIACLISYISFAPINLLYKLYK